MNDSTTVARLTCDEPTARRLAVLGESLDTEKAVCAAFEGAGGEWQIAIHFRAPPDQAAVRALVKLAADEEAAAALRFEQVAAADWVQRSLAGLAPVRVGRFVVHGAHDRAKVPINAIAVEIEAGLAFGTGHHATTRGCLQALDALARRRRMRNTLDIGTGSGVLAIAAAKTFRAPVVASDIDPSAVTTARGNARLNRVASFITLARAAGVTAPTIWHRRPYDLIFANILLNPLIRLAVPFARLSAPGARVVLSGLLPAQGNAAIAIYRAQGLALMRRIVLQGWVTLVMQAPPRRLRARSGGQKR